MSYSFSSFTEQLQSSLSHTQGEVKKLRTGRATVSMLDGVYVEAYGSRMRVPEVAGISAPDATLLVISPWDKSLLQAIEKGVQAADLNLHPVVDGEIIRIAVPSLTQENRETLVKKLHQVVEAGRIGIRSARNETKKEIEDQKGTAGVSEDDIKADVAELETKVKQALETLEKVLQEKEKELRTL
ncbi:MAG: ribosome recycling factor [bacterium]|nr:ribosome recycling factor [bacterium]